METTVDGRNFATPRGWEDLSNLIKIYEKLGKTVDREVVVQYIQYPKIAKDFANYLELYYKYRTDYQIEEILRGRLDEILLKKVAHASFDERLSVLGLLISKVNEALKSSVQTERYMEMIFAMLSGYKESVKDEMQELNGQQLLQNVISKFNLDYKNRKKAELIRQEEEKIYLRVIAFLERLLQMLKLEDIRDKGEAFERVKELFEQEREAFEIGQRETLQIVEYVFDFLEGAFGNSQEMVIFITELNSNPYSVSFLQACECERYYRYNKELLFDEKRKRLLERMNL